MRILIAGGGTGGHLFPGLALADALAARGASVTFVGTAAGIEARAVPAAGYPLRLLPGRQLRGGGMSRALAGLASAAGGTLRALALLGELRPRLVVGVGGYASVAVVIAASLRRIPTVLLEQNVVPGAANRVLARFARRICVGFAESIAFLPRARAVHTGNPVRADLIRPRPPRARPGLLVFGGSAGAHRLNQAMRAGAAEMILDAALDGERLATALRALLEDAGRRVTMAARARALGRPDAAERVATECLRLAAA